MTAIVFVTSVAPSPAPATIVAGGRRAVIFGAYVEPVHGQDTVDAITALEGSIDRTLAGIRVFDVWDSRFPNADTTWMRDSGHAIFLSVRAKRSNGAIIRFRDIANAKPGSALYDQIVGWADAIKGFGAHLYFTFNHEPDAAASEPNGSAADFVAGWRRIVDVFRARKVTNAEYVWIVTDYAFRRKGKKQARDYYPGDHWVDDIAEDAYNWNGCRPGIDDGWRSLEELAKPMRRFGRAHPGKHLMLTEWGSVEDPNSAGRKARWIEDAAATLKSPGWGSFSAALYFDSTDPEGRVRCNWRLDTSGSAMAAFAAMGKDRYFQARPHPSAR